ncbi:MAG: aspartate/glutamate racemase family protein [Thermovirgaceae bacterium]|jgi:hypothetical protein|nr:aspartate/glutamate racemase family protein [Thermovirga sp.]
MVKAGAPPKVGILCWEEGHVPRGLAQLESLKGNSTNPDTYDFPVRFCRVKGANIQTILESPDRKVLQEMIREARLMVSDGVRAITTSCGFNAIFQKELASSLDVPVFTSSLLLVPLVHAMLGPKAEIGVITAKKAALRKEHLEAVGIHEEIPLRLFGLEECPEWGKIFTDPDEDISLETVETEVTGTAREAIRQYPGIRTFVLECTDLPPFSESIRKTTNLPVFDFIGLVEMVARSL